MNGLAVQSTDVIETTRVEWLSLPSGWVLVLVLAPALILLCRWLYGHERFGGRSRWMPAVLRGLALALMLAFLFHPVRSKQRVKVEKPVAAVLLDDSASLRERDLGGLAPDHGLPADATRHEVLQAALAEPLAALGERYDLLTYAFGDTLRAVGGLGDLQAADGETRLGDAIAALAAETRGRELAQVIVVTDGRVNAGRDVQAAVAAQPGGGVPLNTIGVGDPDVPRDVRIANITSPEVALAGDTVTLEVSVAARGHSGQLGVLTVTDSERGFELAREDIRLAESEGPAQQTEQLVRVSFIPEVEGEIDLRVAVQPMPGERDTSNNTERRMLRVEPGRIKVLYVDGYPRYEYRFLKDSLLRVENMDVQVFLQSATSEFIQESTSGVSSLTRVPDDVKFLLDNYHVIVLGDVDPHKLGNDPEKTMQAFKEFVEAGGGLLMQAGTRYSPKAYIDTPLADVLPVLIGEPATEWQNVGDAGTAFRPVLTQPRDPHEIVSLEPDTERNRALWEGEDGLAPLNWYWPVAKARSTAEVLLTHPRNGNAHGPHVLLATMYYPQGRVAFLATDETWRWRFRFLETYREPFWRGLIRYLALNRLRRADYRFDLSTDLSSYSIGERIQITARVRDDDFDPLVAESFPVVLVTPGGRRESLDLDREEDGVFGGSLPASEPGPYRLWLEDLENPGSEPKSPRIVTVSVPSTETEDPVLDESLLQRLAARTGGRYERLADAERLLSSLDDPARERPLDEPEREELWAGWPQLALLVLLLGSEWVLRKRSNLV